MALDTLTKQPTESRLYTMDFTPLLGATENITSITSVTALPSGLTLSGQVFVAKKAQIRVAAGTTGVSYKLTFVVATDASNTLEGEGLLIVRDL